MDEFRRDDYRRDLPMRDDGQQGLAAPPRYFEEQFTQSSQETERERRRRDRKREKHSRRTQELSGSASGTQDLTQRLAMSQDSYTAFDDMAHNIMNNVFSSQSQSQGYSQSQSQDFPGYSQSQDYQG